MSYDLQVVKIVDSVPVTKVGVAAPAFVGGVDSNGLAVEVPAPVAGTTGLIAVTPENVPSTRISLTGRNFLSAEEVKLNGNLVDFEVVGDRRIEIELPESMESEYIRTVTVLSSSFTGREASVMEFVAGSHLRKVTGLLKAMQQFIKVMMTSPGTDIFHKTYGGGLLSTLSTNLDYENSAPMIGQILASLSRTSKQIISSQASKRLPADEKLKSVVLLDLKLSKQDLSVDLVLGFETMAGIRAHATLGI
jgi:hypothetical protein